MVPPEGGTANISVSYSDGTQFKDGNKSVVAEVNQEDTSESAD